MFKSIEKTYKKNLRVNKFNTFYWISAVTLIIIGSMFNLSDNIKLYFIYIMLFILVLIYFIIDFFKVTKNVRFKRTNSLPKAINFYFCEIEKQNINNLILLLKKYNFKTKNDIKLAIDYFNSEKPTKIESDYLGWIVSAALTVSSFIEIAYNSDTKTIDTAKLSIIFSSTFGILILFLFPIVAFYFIINKIFISKKETKSLLAEDLTYIYLNFNKYKNQLTKKQSK